MRKQQAFAYLAAAVAAGLLPMLVLVLISIPAWHGMATLRGFVVLGIAALALALVYLAPIAVILRRMLLFRAGAMGVAGFLPVAAMMTWIAIVAEHRLPNGTSVPLSWGEMVPGVVFYGMLGALAGVTFHFVFRTIAGNDRLAPGGKLDA